MCKALLCALQKVTESQAQVSYRGRAKKLKLKTIQVRESGSLLKTGVAPRSQRMGLPGHMSEEALTVKTRQAMDLFKVKVNYVCFQKKNLKGTEPFL